MAKFKWDNLILFVEQLAAASKLGLPVDKTIDIMSKDSLDRGWAKTQIGVSELVRLGSPLSEAMENYPAYFPSVIRRMVKIGEEGRVLPRILHCLSRYLQLMRENQHKLQKCMIYPFLIWTLLMIDLGVVAVYVIPKFTDMLNSMSVESPSLTMFFIGVGPTFFIVVGGTVMLAAWTLIYWLGKDAESGAKHSVWADRILSRIPFLGTIQRHAKAAEMCDVLGILIEEGHSGREAVNLLRSTLDNPSLQSALNDLDTALVTGSAYNPEMAHTLIPQTSLWMIGATGGTPELGHALQELSRYHQRQVEMLSTVLREFIEPFLLIAVAILGGLGIIGLYLAIFSASSNIPGFLP